MAVRLATRRDRKAATVCRQMQKATVPRIFEYDDATSCWLGTNEFGWTLCAILNVRGRCDDVCPGAVQHNQIVVVAGGAKRISPEQGDDARRRCHGIVSL